MTILHPNRKEYRFGFQGQEKDDEVKGNGNSINYKYRMHDPRIGRFFAVDPLTAEYPYYSPYQFSGNRLIDMVELEGLEPIASGSYSGQGAQAPIREEGDAIQPGSENTRWVWNNSAWSQYDLTVTQNDLSTLYPRGNSSILTSLETTLNLEGQSYGISTKEELAGFIGQTGHETEGFTKLSEDVHRYTLKNLKGFKRLGGYSDAHLRKTMKNPNDVAVLLYGGTGGGLDYRGRGLIHTTWFDGYREASKTYNARYGTSHDFTKTPGVLATDNQIAVRTALIFFQNNGLFSQSQYDINKTSRTVNRWDSGTFGTRKSAYTKALNQLNQ